MKANLIMLARGLVVFFTMLVVVILTTIYTIGKLCGHIAGMLLDNIMDQTHQVMKVSQFIHKPISR